MTTLTTYTEYKEKVIDILMTMTKYQTSTGLISEEIRRKEIEKQVEDIDGIREYYIPWSIPEYHILSVTPLEAATELARSLNYMIEIIEKYS